MKVHVRTSENECVRVGEGMSVIELMDGGLEIKDQFKSHTHTPKRLSKRGLVMVQSVRRRIVHPPHVHHTVGLSNHFLLSRADDFGVFVLRSLKEKEAGKGFVTVEGTVVCGDGEMGHWAREERGGERRKREFEERENF